jgi:acyl-CoA thioester hydrolase
MQAVFELKLAVRDYECDLQGVVNNAVYQNYLEHARHEFLRSRGINFAALAAEGINLVVTRIELDYRASLTSGDEFVVLTRIEQVSRLRFAFFQTIRRLSDGRTMLEAVVTGSGVSSSGRPFLPESLLDLMAGMQG